MDYLEALRIDRHSSFARFQDWLAAEGRRLVLLTTKGETDLWDFVFRPDDVLWSDASLRACGKKSQTQRRPGCASRSSRRCAP